MTVQDVDVPMAPMPAPVRRTTLATAALTVALLSVVTVWVPLFGFMIAGTALGLGIWALATRVPARGRAISGTVIAAVTTLLGAVLTVAGVAGALGATSTAPAQDVATQVAVGQAAPGAVADVEGPATPGIPQSVSVTDKAAMCSFVEAVQGGSPATVEQGITIGMAGSPQAVPLQYGVIAGRAAEQLNPLWENVSPADMPEQLRNFFTLSQGMFELGQQQRIADPLGVDAAYESLLTYCR